MAVSTVASEAPTGYLIDPEWGHEREPLHLLAHMCDPWTRERIEVLGITRGWRCLAVGAGNGSIAAWLARRVGPEGRVIATDIDLRFVDGLDEPNLEILRHDVAADDLPGSSFDLIHARWCSCTSPNGWPFCAGWPAGWPRVGGC